MDFPGWRRHPNTAVTAALPLFIFGLAHLNDDDGKAEIGANQESLKRVILSGVLHIYCIMNSTCQTYFLHIVGKICISHSLYSSKFHKHGRHDICQKNYATIVLRSQNLRKKTR